MWIFDTPNKSTAQKLSDINKKVQSGQWVDWSDYSSIQNLQNDTVPKTLEYLDGEINRIEKIAVTTRYTQEMKNAEKQEWEKYKQSIETLRKSWKDGHINIKNHKKEVYEKTKELVRWKLEELLGGIVTESPKTPEAPIQDVGGNKSIPTLSDVRRAGNVPPNTPTVPNESPQKTKPPRKSVTKNGEKMTTKANIEKSPLEKWYSTVDFPKYIDVKNIKSNPKAFTVDFPFTNVINADSNRKITSLQYPASNLNQSSWEKTITGVMIDNTYYKNISISHEKDQNGKIIFTYSEKKEDFSAEGKKIKEILDNLNIRGIRYENGMKIWVNAQTGSVDLAEVPQKNWVRLIYDTIDTEWQRYVYALRWNTITWSIRINKAGAILKTKWEPIRDIPFNVEIPVKK